MKKIKPVRCFRGEGNPSARLTEAQVREIRAKYHSGGVRQTQLAYEYGVSLGTICRILNEVCWRHILPPRRIAKREAKPKITIPSVVEL